MVGQGEEWGWAGNSCCEVGMTLALAHGCRRGWGTLSCWVGFEVRAPWSVPAVRVC